MEQLKIKEYKHWTVYLHDNQCYLGRVYIWSKRDGLVDLLDMTEEEQREFFDVGRKVKKAIAELFNPDLMNYASLGNVSTHLHMHVIPRYQSTRTFEGNTFIDERWGKNYAPYDKDFKIPEETLFRIRDAIKAKLP